MYIYPSNLRARATLLLWSLRDIAVTVVLALVGVLALTQTGTPIFLAVAAAYAFLAIRYDEASILDYLKRAWRFLVAEQQLYKWSNQHED